MIRSRQSKVWWCLMSFLRHLLCSLNSQLSSLNKKKWNQLVFITEHFIKNWATARKLSSTFLSRNLRSVIAAHDDLEILYNINSENSYNSNSLCETQLLEAFYDNNTISIRHGHGIHHCDLNNKLRLTFSLCDDVRLETGVWDCESHKSEKWYLRSRGMPGPR